MNDLERRLLSALKRVIAEADLWHDDDRGGDAPGLEKERKLVNEVEESMKKKPSPSPAKPKPGRGKGPC